MGERTESSGERTQAAAAHWRRVLDDALPLLGFPTDRARPASVREASAQVELPVPEALGSALRALAAAQGTTLQEILCAAYQVFLARYAGQQDLLIGVASPFGAGRRVPLRQAMDPALPFVQLLQRNREAMAAVAACGEHDFDAVAPAAAGADRSHAPVYQHAFASEGGTPGLLDTLLAASQGDGGLRLVLHYNAALFEPESAARWARNFTTLLGSIAASPGQAIGRLPLLHADELAFIAASLDRTRGPFACPPGGVHAAFERQAAKTPEAPAVRCGASVLSYAELDGRANAIARRLREEGVRAEDLVGVCCARGTDMVAAVIGVLKLGAAYVPMDTKYPVRRLQAIADEARLRHVLCDERGAGLFGERVLAVRLETIEARAARIPQPVVDGEALSHVIFTSGSTGTPKGVMARHRNTMAFLAWIRQHYTAEELAVTLCCSSLCFDLTVFELWGPLTVGGLVVVVDNAAALVQRAEPDVTLVNTVPTALRLLVDERALPAATRTVNVCGEPLDAQLVADLFAAYPGVVFYNTYGPTEDTAYSTFFRMTGPVAEDPPIGEPLVHEFGRIVDAQGELVPVGAVGDLCIGGAGVARGYLYNPEGTAARFFESASYDGTPAAAYRSGDYVRLRNDGQLHFVGRRDDQIKLRGFRIDLGDVVHALHQIPGVSDARVLVRPHKGANVLVGYLAHERMPAGTHRDPALLHEVEQGARERLPAFMVPSFIVLFDKLPLNENGKVDRHALASIDFDLAPRPAAGAPAQREADADEQAVAAIWCDVLALRAVGLDEDFFELGGNSLLAVRMVSRLNKRFGSNLPAQAVFDARTVAALARLARGEAGGARIALEKVDAGAGVRPTFPQLAMLMDPGKTSFNLCSAARIEGPLHEAALRRALGALVQRHDVLRARFAPPGMDVRMQVHEEHPDILRVVEVTPGDADGGEAQAAELLQREWRRPFDLAAGGPVRALLVRMAPERHALMLSVHHVATDEWSNNILRQDLGRLYAAELDDGELPPEPLPFGFADFAHWQARLHETEAYRRQLMFWAGELAAVAVDGPFPLGGDADPGCVTRHLELPAPAALPAQLAALAARGGHTPFVVVLAALQLALAAHSGLSQQLVWAPVARRAEPELEDVVGLFTNLAALGARVDRGSTLAEFLAATERKVAQARANGDVSALTAAMMNPAAMPQLPMVGLNFIELPTAGDWSLAGTQAREIPMRLHDEADLCVLELVVRPRQGALRFSVAYGTAAFGAAAVQRIVDGLWSAIEGFERTPGARIGDWLPQPQRAEAPAAVAAA